MTASSVQVRLALDTDFDAILALLKQLALETMNVDSGHEPPDPRQRAAWSRILTQAGRSLLVAETDRVVGTADLLVVDNLTHDGMPWAIVENVVVDATRRGHGVGHALMGAVVERARAAGCYKVQLMSNEARVRAHAFYRSLGFVPNAEGFRLYLG